MLLTFTVEGPVLVFSARNVTRNPSTYPLGVCGSATIYAFAVPVSTAKFVVPRVKLFSVGSNANAVTIAASKSFIVADLTNVAAATSIGLTNVEILILL